MDINFIIGFIGLVIIAIMLTVKLPIFKDWQKNIKERKILRGLCAWHNLCFTYFCRIYSTICSV